MVGEPGECGVDCIRAPRERRVLDLRPHLAEQLAQRLRVLGREGVERVLARFVREQSALGRDGVNLVGLLGRILRGTAAGEEHHGDCERTAHAPVVAAGGERQSRRKGLPDPCLGLTVGWGTSGNAVFDTDEEAHMLKRLAIPLTLLTALVAALALGSVPALAKDGDVLARGACTGRSTAKLKLSPENGRIEIEFEVDQNRTGVPWKVVLTRNGSTAARLTRVTRAPSGSFTAQRVLGDAAGADVVRATASRNGERCTASATFRG
jgi:hypothetical protein